MHKIAIDITTLMDQYSHRGIGKYTGWIIPELLNKAIPGEHIIYLLGFGNLLDNLQQMNLSAGDIVKFDGAPTIRFISLGAPQLSNPLNNLRVFNRRIMPELNKIKPNVYFSPYFERGLPSTKYPTIVTVHDAIPLATNNFSQKGRLQNWLKGQSYKVAWNKQKYARQLIAVSNTTKQEIIKFGLPEDKIDVVYHGIHQNFFEVESHAESIEYLGKIGLMAGEYLLYDSGLEQNKNIPDLLKLCQQLITAWPKIKLAVTGNLFTHSEPNHTAAAEFKSLAQELNIWDKIVTPGRVTEPQLYRLFANAKAYVNLSDYEGFGFGPLQAMAAGVPAIISTLNDAFVELSAAAAININPKDAAAAAQIVDLFTDSDAIAHVIASGAQHATQFTWNKCGMQTWDIIISTLDSPTKA